MARNLNRETKTIFSFDTTVENKLSINKFYSYNIKKGQSLEQLAALDSFENLSLELFVS